MIPWRSEVPNKTVPVTVLTLIVLNSVIFFYQQMHYNAGFLWDTFALVPVKIFLLHDPRFYLTLITYMFLHASWLHYIGNMLFLWVFGPKVEDILGHTGFGYFFLLTGISAGFIHAFMHPDSAVPTIGASGAISGVLAAYMVLYPVSKVVFIFPVSMFFLPFKVPAYVLIGLWFISQFFWGLSSLSPGSPFLGVAWFAHIGGFIVGILLLPIFLLLRKIV